MINYYIWIMELLLQLSVVFPIWVLTWVFYRKFRCPKVVFIDLYQYTQFSSWLLADESQLSNEFI